MLALAQVTAEDLVYDLGCGDGRIVITAAEQWGARGLGVDLDPERIREAKQRAKQAGIEHLVRFKQQNLLNLKLSPATVVALYLLPGSNLRLRDKLRSELAPGSRIVTHSFDMGDWPPSQVTQVSDVINTYPIYLWQL
ncbi:class I SAM-dependent methyltransferase [Leptolyngbya sp. FACHB-261]|nr:class I SAM-dependent methyltransferase [Leptolyngbya sp. FACHB-261]